MHALTNFENKLRMNTINNLSELPLNIKSALGKSIW